MKELSAKAKAEAAKHQPVVQAQWELALNESTKKWEEGKSKAAAHWAAGKAKALAQVEEGKKQAKAHAAKVRLG